MEVSKLCCILPGELVIDILKRLPVKELLKFRTVCKSWNALTKDRAFIEHQSKGSSSPTIIMKHGLRTTLFSLICNTTLRATSPIKMPLVMDNEKFTLSMLGPCNGIICLYGHWIESDIYQNDEDFALWNPATREMKVIPSPNHIRLPALIFDARLKYAFGYDPATNDYKILKMIEGYMATDDYSLFSHRKSGFDIYQVGEAHEYYDRRYPYYGHDNTTNYVVQRLEVYSLNKNSWKLVKTKNRFNLNYSSSGCRNIVHVYSNGFCYWMRDNVIASVDMTNLEFCEMKLLPEAASSPLFEGFSRQLIEVEGDLCLMFRGLGWLHLWALVDKQWVKKNNVIKLPIKDNGSLYKVYQVLMIRDNGDVVLRIDHGGWLVICDWRGTVMGEPRQFKVPSIDAIVYCKESLVSLKRASIDVVA